MRRRRFLSLPLSAVVALAQSKKGQPESDPILRAMQEEIERARELKLAAAEAAPYYIECALDDAESFGASASLGALINSRRTRFRLPKIQVRVGNYDFDNTNFAFTDFFSGPHFEQWPLENNYPALRQALWLALDAAYKGSIAGYGAKQSALRNLTVTEKVADFNKAEPLQFVQPMVRVAMDEAALQQQVKAISAIFRAYPAVLNSSVEFESGQSTFYMVNSEGTRLRYPDNMVSYRIRASGQAADGMTVRDALLIQANTPQQLPPEAELKRRVQQMADNLQGVIKAPVGESYSGPVLFEGEAAAQLMADLLGGNLTLPRRPVQVQGRNMPLTVSEFESRFGSRVLPEWLDVVDDPTQREWRGRPLIGHYEVDYEGVSAKPLTLVEKGKLKNYLLTRQPVRTYTASNGRARLPGSFGARTATYSNLFVKASETVSSKALREKLVTLCKERGKAYGLVVRKLDFPSTGSVDEMRKVMAASGQGSGSTRPASLPILVYKVGLDGKEELVRGLRFRGLNTKSLRDIVAASDEQFLFDLQFNTAPFALVGQSNSVAPCSVISPSLLLDDVELERPQEELPRLPVVPPPANS